MSLCDGCGKSYGTANTCSNSPTSDGVSFPAEKTEDAFCESAQFQLESSNEQTLCDSLPRDNELTASEDEDYSDEESSEEDDENDGEKEILSSNEGIEDPLFTDENRAKAKQSTRPKFTRFRAKEYTCDDCDRMFTLKHNLQQHYLQYHMGVRQLRKVQEIWRCENCDKNFNNGEKYDRHFNFAHSVKTPRVHSCPHCEKVYSSSTLLREHIDVVHQLVFRHQCPKCHIKFGRVNGMRRHVRMVHENKLLFCPYIKDGCLHSGFKCPKALAAHVRSNHTLERPYTCKFCSKAFTRQSDMKNHQRRHPIPPETKVKVENSTECAVIKLEPKDEPMETETGVAQVVDTQEVEKKEPIDQKEIEDNKPQAKPSSAKRFRPDLEAVAIKRRMPPRRLSKEAILARIKK